MKLSVGDTVQHAAYGVGRVIQVLESPFPYLVLFESKLQEQCKLGELILVSRGY